MNADRPIIAVYFRTRLEIEPLDVVTVTVTVVELFCASVNVKLAVPEVTAVAVNAVPLDGVTVTVAVFDELAVNVPP
jgi:hypothetical protein